MRRKIFLKRRPTVNYKYTGSVKIIADEEAVLKEINALLAGMGLFKVKTSIGKKNITVDFESEDSLEGRDKNVIAGRIKQIYLASFRKVEFRCVKHKPNG